MLDESLHKLALEYGVTVERDILFRYRKTSEFLSRRSVGSLSASQAPIGACLDQLASMFDLEYSFRDGVHYLSNPEFHWESNYAHSDRALKRVSEVTPQLRGLLPTHAGYLDLSAPVLEGLAAVHRWLGPLLSSREQIVLYAALPTDIRDRIDRGESIPCSALPPNLRRLYWNMLGCDVSQVPSSEMERYLLSKIRGANEALDVTFVDPR